MLPMIRKQRTAAMQGGGGTYVTLPQYLLADTGDTLLDFSTLTGWTAGAGTMELDEVNTRTGGASVKLISPVGADGYMTKTISSKTFAAGESFRLRFYVHDITTLNSILLYWNLTYYVVIAASLLHNGWNTLDVFASGWAGGGAPVNSTSIRFYVRPKTGVSAAVSFDQAIHNQESVPAVMIMFDDGFASDYTVAYSYCQPKQIRCTSYIITSLIDSAGCMTAAQLQELYDAGCALGSHADTPALLIGLTEEQVSTRLTTAKNTLDGLGFTSASSLVAYPGGDVDANVLAGMAAANMLHGRALLNYGFPATDETDMDYYFGVNLPLTSSTTLAAATAMVDKAISDKRLVVFQTHQLLASPSAADWYIDRFQGLMDYIYANNVPVITHKDWYDLKSGTVRVRVK